MFYSFDVFDTCLGRICGDAKNIFDVVALEVLGRESELSKLNDFRYIREKGEKIARNTTKKEDITLEEIYQHCDFSVLTNKPNSEILQVELEIEEKNLFAIYDVLAIVKKLHKRGKSVAYISDMYLPSTFIINILKREGFWGSNDKLYVSCECNATKSKGNLYDFVREKEKIKLLCWLHRGDNKRSDFWIPLSKGILAFRVKNNYSKYECLINKHNPIPQTRSISIFAGISRSIRLGIESNPKVLFAADLIAPIYVPFVYEIMKDASQRGIRELFFLARDGYIFLQIAKQFKNIFPLISVHYLYVSRKSLYLPSLEKINKESVDKLFPENRTIKETLDYLHISVSQVELQKLEETTSFFDALMSVKKIERKIVERWQEQKKLCLDYFIQEGLASNKSLAAIVDLRGSRKSQVSINKLLTNGGYLPVHGYYLEVTDDRSIDGSGYNSYCYADSITNNYVYKGLRKASDLLEHYFSITPYKRTSHYTKNVTGVEPVFDNKEIVNPHAESDSVINIDICVQYANKMLMLHQQNNGATLMNLGFMTLSSFVQNPDPNYLKALTNVYTSQTQLQSKKLIDRVGVRSIINKEVRWYEGSILFTYGTLALWLYKNVIKRCAKIFLKK